MDIRLELVTILVSDIDRAKRFYVHQVGFSLEQDVQADVTHRLVELLPPASPCAVALPSATRTPPLGRSRASS